MRFLLILAALFLASCAPPPATQNDPPRDESASPTGSAQEAQACTKQGGTWRRVCLMGTWSCVMTHPDGGKTCKDKKDCKGQCRYEGTESLAPGSTVTGVCQRNSDPCGCFAEVRDGKLQPALCAD